MVSIGWIPNNMGYVGTICANAIHMYPWLYHFVVDLLSVSELQVVISCFYATGIFSDTEDLVERWCQTRVWAIVVLSNNDGFILYYRIYAIPNKELNPVSKLHNIQCLLFLEKWYIYCIINMTTSTVVWILTNKEYSRMLLFYCLMFSMLAVSKLK